MVEQRNIYKGHRYVPKIMGEWNQSESYEGLSIVTHQGTSYTSKKRVPTGIDISNEEYWVITGNYNAQIEYYRNDVEELEKGTSEKIEKVNVRLNESHLSLEEFTVDFPENDDTGRLKRAIAKAKLTGQKIFIPAKKYKFSSTLDMFSRVGFVGQSKYGSILEFTGTGKAFNFVDEDLPVREFGQGCEYNDLGNFTLLGPSRNSATTAIAGEIRYNIFADLFIDNFGKIFDVTNNWTNKYINCLFRNADIWYQAKEQNNAVSFINCYFQTSRVGFQMKSAYMMSFVGGNIEGCTEVVLNPFSTAARWSNLTFDHTYLENPASFIDTNHLAGDESVVTSWQIPGFSMDHCNVNSFNEAPFMITKINDVVTGGVKNTNFYKMTDGKLFDMISTSITFEKNGYFYYSATGIKPLTNVFTDYMVQWNTLYQSITQSGNNTTNYSGNIKAEKGIINGTNLAGDGKLTAGHQLYSQTSKMIRIGNGGSTTLGFNWLQPIMSGLTSARPTYLTSTEIGFVFYDTTLKKPIWWGGTSWFDSTGLQV